MTLNDFVLKWQGEWVEVAGSQALNQCVDLANLYIRDFLGFPIIEWTNAIDFPSKIGSLYNYILNTPSGIPLEGDLVIWGGSPYGHIAIFVEGNSSSFRSFDQNWPSGSDCHIQNHTYTNVLGWMHPLKDEQSPDEKRALAVLEENRIAYNYGNLEATARALSQSAVELSIAKSDLASKNDELVRLRQSYEDEMTKNTDFGVELKQKEDELKTEIDKFNAVIAQKDAEIEKLMGDIASCEKAQQDVLQQATSQIPEISTLDLIKELLNRILRR